MKKKQINEKQKREKQKTKNEKRKTKNEKRNARRKNPKKSDSALAKIYIKQKTFFFTVCSDRLVVERAVYARNIFNRSRVRI